MEDFAPYATELLPHRRELANNLQSVEYFSSLFEVEHLRAQNEPNLASLSLCR